MCIAINLYEYYNLLQNMQRRDSLGLTTKIPRLSKGSTQKSKTRRRQSSFSSVSDVFADNESTKGQADLSVRGMKLRSDKSLDGNHGRSAEAGPASEALMDPFDEAEQTLIRPDFEPGKGRKSKGRRRPRSVPRSNREKRCCSGEFPNQRPRVISGENNNNLWSSRARMR